MRMLTITVMLCSLAPIALGAATPSPAANSIRPTAQVPAERTTAALATEDSPCFPADPELAPDLNHCEAIIRQARAHEMDPHALASAHNNRGVLLARSQRWDEALQAFEEALALQPRLDVARLNRGNVMLQLQRYAEAMEDYAAVMSVRGPLTRTALFNRAFALRALADPAQAAADLESARSEL